MYQYKPNHVINIEYVPGCYNPITTIVCRHKPTHVISRVVVSNRKVVLLSRDLGNWQRPIEITHDLMEGGVCIVRMRHARQGVCIAVYNTWL